LAERVHALEERIHTLEALLNPIKGKLQADAGRATRRKQFETRAAADRARYSREDLQEIERLYQVANRQWQSEEARESLKKLVSDYKHANRTGCALLYLGQMTEGEESINYLTAAMEHHGDCWYGDGVQVGAYARHYLAARFRQQGDDASADALLDEIRNEFPDAVDHKGNLLRNVLPQ
jgi:hypothetical protein